MGIRHRSSHSCDDEHGAISRVGVFVFWVPTVVELSERPDHERDPANMGATCLALSMVQSTVRNLTSRVW